MPFFLKLYFLGLLIAGAIAVLFYFAIGHHATPVFHRLLGPRAGDSGARSFRLLMAISVVIGALSVQWYGCHGYTDYKALANDRLAMVEKTSQQVSGGLWSGLQFLLAASFLCAIIYAVLYRQAKSRVSDDEP
jgi:hypothetical protein